MVLKFTALCLILFLQTGLDSRPKRAPASSYYLYDGKPLRISESNFKRYIVPQLRTMGREYLNILKKLHPLQESLIALKGELTEMNESLEAFQNACWGPSDLRANCAANLAQLHRHSRKFDHSMLTLYHHSKLDFSLANNQREITALMALIRSLDQIAGINHHFLHALEKFLITSQTDSFPSSSEAKSLELSLHQMSSSTEMLQTLLLQSELKRDFDFAWQHFFRPLEKHVLEGEGVLFMLRTLEPLNIAWNTFHMKITTEGHKLPSNIITIAKTMHNRWNSVLKIILNN